ncbi:MAG TPA: cupin domain-containing protein [Blastocatellia bacterium]|nr:cupin domain-containing protein [Blastocatellia bacterium]
MKLYNWREIEEEQITDHLTRRYISSERVTLARFFLKKGCAVAAHSHENEQLSTIISGAIKFVIEGKEIVVRAGETLVIPPFTPHSAEAIEDTDALDVFSPARSDWVEGRDDYLRGKPAE